MFIAFLMSLALAGQNPPADTELVCFERAALQANPWLVAPPVVGPPLPIGRRTQPPAPRLWAPPVPITLKFERR